MSVYVMGCEGSDLVKIGCTANPVRRMDDMQRMSPHQFKFLWMSSCEYGRKAEHRLHTVFGLYRKHGEWFDFGISNPVALISFEIESPRLRRRRDREKDPAVARSSEGVQRYDRPRLVEPGNEFGWVESDTTFIKLVKEDQGWVEARWDHFDLPARAFLL